MHVASTVDSLRLVLIRTIAVRKPVVIVDLHLVTTSPRLSLAERLVLFEEALVVRVACRELFLEILGWRLRRLLVPNLLLRVPVTQTFLWELVTVADWLIVVRVSSHANVKGLLIHEVVVLASMGVVVVELLRVHPLMLVVPVITTTALRLNCIRMPQTLIEAFSASTHSMRGASIVLKTTLPLMLGSVLPVLAGSLLRINHLGLHVK